MTTSALTRMSASQIRLVAACAGILFVAIIILPH
jgi:hypothetical protein